MTVKYIAMDCESGGVVPGVTLLTAHFIFLDKDLNIIDELNLKLKPKDDIYSVTAEALSVNRIDLIEHDKKAIKKDTAGQLLWNFLVRHSNAGETKLIPIGHNVSGDIQWINDHILGQKTWHNYVSYRKLDTGTIAQYLKAIGKIPEEVSGSLQSLVEHYNLTQLSFHNERDDAQMTVNVLRKMLQQ